MANELSLRSYLVPVTDSSAIAKRLATTTYVGIDFGTSTTVASYAVGGNSEQPLMTERISIAQPLPDGRIYRNYLVPTALGWMNDQLFFGEGARQSMVRAQGRNYWSSFKMQLGLDLGPQYYDSQLGEGHPVATILTPRDAATEFLKFLRKGIEEEVERLGLPTDIQYSVSIPASFEANQRRDLATALKEAGVPIGDNAFVDEPNAAFLSYVAEANSNELGSFMVPDQGALDILVFDFGAGTCDISVLEVRSENATFKTKNLAISRFEALGGDNIDRVIAREVLLPQIEEQNELKSADWRTPDLKKRVLPALQAIAERLKIKICKAVAGNTTGRALPEFATAEEEITLPGEYTVSLPRADLHLAQPTLSFAQFSSIMGRFLDPMGASDTHEDDVADAVFSVFTPVHSALDKARLQRDALDLVLLIGGSCENPYVQKALADFFSEGALVIPQNLRSHVSIGAALNSFLVNGLGRPMVHPITSEPIMIITRDETELSLIPSGTQMPSRPFQIDDLQVHQTGQQTVEIPICVSGRDKIMSVIRIAANDSGGFRAGTRVTITGQLTIDKLLEVEAEVAGEIIKPEMISPFANRELTTREREVLAAEKNANATASCKKDLKQALWTLAKAYGQAGRHRRAAETYELLERRAPQGEFETSLCYHWAMADREDLSTLWAKKAHAYSPGKVTAYNLALSMRREEDIEAFEKLMKESLEYDPEYPSALWVLGKYYQKEGREDGGEMIHKAFSILHNDFVNRRIDEEECRELGRIAHYLGKRDVVTEVRHHLDQLETAAGLFDPGNLVISKATNLMPRGKLTNAKTHMGTTRIQTRS